MASVRSFDELIRRARRIQHEQTRRESEEFLEMVMFRDSWNDLTGLFTDYFGPALKSAGEEPSDEAEKIAGPHGGIAKEQVLFHTIRDNGNHLAMIWPWSDGRRMTVKILQE